MGTKLLVQRDMGGDPESPSFQAYISLLKKAIEKVKNRDTEVRFRILKKGLTNLKEICYSYLHFINDREVLEAVLDAEKEGFDAVLVSSFSDPAVNEARQAMNIPVVGLAQPSMLTALMMGSRFGVVAVSPESAPRNEELVMKYGLRERAILPVKSMPISPEEQFKMIEDSRHGIEAFKEVSRAYIRDGAEVIISACGRVSLALRFAPGCPELPNGLTEIDGVPVLDTVGCAVKWAEMMVALKRAGSSWISRSGLYVRPDAELSKAAREKIPYRGSGFIDVE